MAKPNPNAPVGQGGRFAAMVQKTGSPALAAYIGRKKYGDKGMARMAAVGRRLHKHTQSSSSSSSSNKKNMPPASNSNAGY